MRSCLSISDIFPRLYFNKVINKTLKEFPQVLLAGRLSQFIEEKKLPTQTSEVSLNSAENS